MPTFGLFPPSSSTSSSPAYGCSGGVYWQPAPSSGDCIKYQCHRAVPLLPTPPHFSFGPGPPGLYHAPPPHACVIPVSGPLSGSLGCIPPVDILSHGTSFHNDIGMNSSSVHPFNLVSSSSPFGPLFPQPNSSPPGFVPLVAPLSPSSPSLSFPSMVPPVPPFTFQEHHPSQSLPSESTSRKGISCMAYPFSCSNSLSDGFGCFQDANHQDNSVTSPSPVFSTWLHPLNRSSIPSASLDDGPCSELLADCRTAAVSSSFLHQPYVGHQYPSPLALPPGSQYSESLAVPQSADDARVSGHFFFSSEDPPSASFPEIKHHGNPCLSYLKRLDSEEISNNWSLDDRLWNVGIEYGHSSISPEELRWERHQRLLGHQESKLNVQLVDSGNSAGSYVHTCLPGLCSGNSEHAAKKDELSPPASLGYPTPSLKWAASAFAEMLATASESSHDPTTPLPLDFGASNVLASSLSSSLALIPPSLYRVSSLSGLSYYKLNGELDDHNSGTVDSSHYGPGLSACEDQVRVPWDDPLMLAPVETQKQGQRLGKNVAGEIMTNGNCVHPGYRPKRNDPSIPKRSKAWYAKEVSAKSLSPTRKNRSRGAKEISTDAVDTALAPEYIEGENVTSENSLRCAAHCEGEDLKLNHLKAKQDLERKGSKNKDVEDKCPQGSLVHSSLSTQSFGVDQTVNMPESVFSLPVHEIATGQDDTSSEEAPIICNIGIATSPSIGSSSSVIEKPFLESDISGPVPSSQSMFGIPSHGLNVHETFSRLWQDETLKKDGKDNRNVGSSGTQPDIAMISQIASAVDANGDKDTQPGIPVVACASQVYGESTARNTSCSRLCEPGLQSIPQKDKLVQPAKPSHTAFPAWLPTGNLTSSGSSCFGECNSADPSTSQPSVSYPSKLLETSKFNGSEFPFVMDTSTSGGVSSAEINHGVSQEEESVVTPRFTSLTMSVEKLSSVLLACLSSSFSSSLATHIDALQNSVHNISECLLLEVSAKVNHMQMSASTEEVALKNHQDSVKQMQARNLCSPVPSAGRVTELDGKFSRLYSDKSQLQNSEKGSVASPQESNNHQECLQDRMVSQDEFHVGSGMAANAVHEQEKPINSQTYALYDVESLQLELRAKEAEIARLKFQALKNAILKVRKGEEKLVEVEKLRKAEVLIDNLRDELEVEREENKGAMHLYKVMLNEAKEGAAHALREAERIKLELTALKAKMAEGSLPGIVATWGEPETVEARAALIKARQDWCSTRDNQEIFPRHNGELKLCVEYPGFAVGSCGVTGTSKVSHLEAKPNHKIAEEDVERKVVEMRAALIKGRNGSTETDEEIETAPNAKNATAGISVRVDQSAQKTRSEFTEGVQPGNVAPNLQAEGFGSFTNVSADESLKTGLFPEMEEPGWEHVVPVVGYEEAAQS